MRMSVKEKTQPVWNHNGIVDGLRGNIRKSEEDKIRAGFRNEERFHRGQLSRLVIRDRASNGISAHRLQDCRNTADYERDDECVLMESVRWRAQEEKRMDTATSNPVAAKAASSICNVS